MRKSGINSKTPDEIVLGAGTVFKNLRYVYEKVEVEEGSSAPKGVLQVVEDGVTETADTIQLHKLTPDVSFIGLEKDYTPAAGDYVTGAWDDSEENVLGATSGGNKLSISSELMDVEVDGATVKVTGLTHKIGETGSLETNLVQHSVESLKRAIVGKEVDSLIKGYTQVQTKPLIELSDYLDNIAYVGTKTNGDEIIIIMENAICTSGYEIEGKNKESAVVATTFEPSADFKKGVFDSLPIYIFMPEEA